MDPVEFQEANVKFGPPEGMDESQVRTISAHVRRITGGNIDGAQQVIVAWKPTESELEQLKAGGAVYISMIGGLAPHYIGTSFQEVCL